MLYIGIITLIIIAFGIIVMIKNRGFDDSVKLFNNINDIHPKWTNTKTDKVTEEINRLPETNRSNVNNFINDIRNLNDESYLTYEVVETKEDNVTYFDVKVSKKYLDKNIVINVCYKKFDDESNNFVMHYVPAKSNINISTLQDCCIYESHITSTNSEDIRYNMLVYFKIENGKYAEIPMTLNLTIHPYNLKEKAELDIII